MSVSKNTLNTMIAGAFVMTMTAATALPTSEAQASENEKCYGVVKAGKNACASADGKHSCEAHANVDGSGQEWVSLPKGVCDKLVNGSTNPFSANETMDSDHADEHADDAAHADDEHADEHAH